ncbi:hypothetical protein ACP4OV_023419 [Aristida adscensionis]
MASPPRSTTSPSFRAESTPLSPYTHVVVGADDRGGPPASPASAGPRYDDDDGSPVSPLDMPRPWLPWSDDDEDWFSPFHPSPVYYFPSSPRCPLVLPPAGYPTSPEHSASRSPTSPRYFSSPEPSSPAPASPRYDLDSDSEPPPSPVYCYCCSTPLEDCCCPATATTTQVNREPIGHAELPPRSPAPGDNHGQ